MGTIYGYCRCSTDETRQDIDRQRRELRNKIYRKFKGFAFANPFVLTVLPSVLAIFALIFFI